MGTSKNRHEQDERGHGESEPPVCGEVDKTVSRERAFRDAPLRARERQWPMRGSRNSGHVPTVRRVSRTRYLPAAQVF
jgi:hypothetical protein